MSVDHSTRLNGKIFSRNFKKVVRQYGRIVLDAAVVAAGILLAVTPAKVLFFHIIFILLTFGAFYWKFRAFAVRAIFWVVFAAIAILLAVLSGQTQPEEILEIPLLTAILILVFAIAHQRASAEDALRQANEALESRVLERTAELTQANARLVAEIANHKQTTATLRESEERYRRLVELSFEAIAIHSNGKLVYLNSPGVELLGATSAAELAGKPILDFIHPDYQALVQDRMAQAGQGEEGVPLIEEKFLRLDGSSVDVEVAAVPVMYQGKPAVQAVIRDISARKQAELERERLLAKEHQQRVLAETLGDVFLALAAQIRPEAVLDEIMRQARRLVSFDAANLALLKNNTLLIAHQQGYNQNDGDAVLELEQPLDDFPLDAQVIQTRQPLVIPDTRQHPLWVTMPEMPWIRSFMAVPICLGERVLGLLRLDSSTPRQFSNQDAGRLQPLANAAAIALENARLYSQARQEIAEREVVEHELRQLATKNQAILNAIPDSIFNLSRNGEILDCKLHNGSALLEVLSQLNRRSRITDTFDMSSDLVDLTLHYINKTLETGKMQILEYQLPLSNGIRDFEVRLVVSGPDEVLAIFRDITERKARETALQEARSRLARDLHDSLGQNLGYLCLKLDEFSLNRQLARSGDFPQELSQLREVANQAYELVRSMLAAARPANSTSLDNALFAQAKTAGQKGKFKVELNSQGQVRPLSPIVQQQTLFLFQEALANVIKHARASRVSINLDWTGDDLVITMVDDGRGFETNLPRPDGHLGLTIMQERAEEIGGFLSVASASGEGTKITLRLPLPEMAQTAAIYDATA